MEPAIVITISPELADFRRTPAPLQHPGAQKQRAIWIRGELTVADAAQDLQRLKDVHATLDEHTSSD